MRSPLIDFLRLSQPPTLPLGGRVAEHAAAACGRDGGHRLNSPCTPTPALAPTVSTRERVRLPQTARLAIQKQRRCLDQPCARSLSASAKPASSASPTSSAVSAPTPVVTSRSPRSLSGASSRGRNAGDRRMAGQVDGVGDDRRGGVGCRAVLRKHGHRIGNAQRKAAAAPAAGGDAAHRVGRADDDAVGKAVARAGDRERHRLAVGEMKRDVAAIVDIGLVEISARRASRQEFRRLPIRRPRPSA